MIKQARSVDVGITAPTPGWLAMLIGCARCGELGGVPMPGGIGPMTQAMLLVSNVVRARRNNLVARAAAV